MSYQTIYILDDDQAFVDSLVWLLGDSRYKLLAHTDTALAKDALNGITPLQPAVLLLDVRMPQQSGLEFHDELLEAGIDLPVIYLTGHGDVPLAVEAMAKGALTFLEKPVDSELLHESLNEAFSANVQSRRQSSATRLLAAERAASMSTLTPREVEVLNGIVEGLSARKIGETLCISAKTVDFHRARLMAKLQAENVAHLQRIVALQQN